MKDIPSIFLNAYSNTHFLFNRFNYSSYYNINSLLLQELTKNKELKNIEVLSMSDKEAFIASEDNKKAETVGFNEQNEIIKKVKEKELKLTKEFECELININSSKNDVDTKASKIKNVITNYTYKIALNRIKEGFVTNYVPILKDIKTESFLTKIEEEIIINNKVRKSIAHERVKKETALNLIIELYLETFEYLKKCVNSDYITNKEVRDKVKEIVADKIPDSQLVKFVPTANIIFSTSDKYGYFIKNNKRYFNVCHIPVINYRYKENGINWKIEETLDILRTKYKRLYILFKNLFREDKNISYMLNKFAYFLNTYKKWRTAEVVHGVQGAGKGVFAEHFIKKIVGEDNFLTIGNSELQQQFNSFFEYKLFIVANEVAGDITKNNVVNDYLKTLVTEDSIIINTKRIKQYKGQNIFNLIIFSNADEPIKVESSDRRFNVFKTRNQDLKVVAREKFNEKMKDYLEKLDKEVNGFLPILKATKYNEQLIDELVKNNFRLKLKFETNNKIKLLKDLVLKQEFEEIDKFLEHLKKENDLNNELVLEYKDDVVYKFDVSEDNLKKIKEQLKRGGFLTTEQVRLIVALMYCKDIQEKENVFKDKINKFNRAFNLVHKIKINNTKQSIRTCQDADFFEEEREVVIEDILYKVVCVDLGKEKLKFKKYKVLTKLEEASIEEI